MSTRATAARPRATNTQHHLIVAVMARPVSSTAGVAAVQMAPAWLDEGSADTRVRLQLCPA
jgi:hypothetical protein